MDWQPIATAPRDGTQCLLWLRSPYSRVELASWCAPWGVWLISGDVYDPGVEVAGIGSLVPSHWMPEPSPPSTKE